MLRKFFLPSNIRVKKRGGKIVHINVKPTKKYVENVTKTQTIITKK